VSRVAQTVCQAVLLLLVTPFLPHPGEKRSTSVLQSLRSLSHCFGEGARAVTQRVTAVSGSCEAGQVPETLSQSVSDCCDTRQSWSEAAAFTGQPVRHTLKDKKKEKKEKKSHLN